MLWGKSMIFEKGMEGKNINVFDNINPCFRPQKKCVQGYYNLNHTAKSCVRALKQALDCQTF